MSDDKPCKGCKWECVDAESYPCCVCIRNPRAKDRYAYSAGAKLKREPEENSTGSRPGRTTPFEHETTSDKPEPERVTYVKPDRD